MTVVVPVPQIRFTRRGRTKLPFYRIIAIDSRERRDGLPLEVGTACVCCLSHISKLT